MTKNRSHKSAIRAHQAQIGAPYMVARQQLGVPESGALSSPDAVPAGVDILPPLKDWTRPSYCRFWTETAAEHRPLMAVAVSLGLDGGSSMIWSATPPGRTGPPSSGICGSVSAVDSS